MRRLERLILYMIAGSWLALVILILCGVLVKA